MNGPLHEVQHIPYELDPRLEASLPLGPPQEQEPPTSQALHLSATDGEPLPCLPAGCRKGAAACDGPLVA